MNVSTTTAAVMPSIDNTLSQYLYWYNFNTGTQFTNDGNIFYWIMPNNN